jgi:hypothetical protein
MAYTTIEDLHRRLAEAQAEVNAPLRVVGPSLFSLFSAVVKEKFSRSSDERQAPENPQMNGRQGPR